MRGCRVKLPRIGFFQCVADQRALVCFAGLGGRGRDGCKQQPASQQKDWSHGIEV
jgi:hypothetical protein